MRMKYNFNIEDEVFDRRLHILINKIYKLLPTREDGDEWHKPLDTIIEEIAGMNRLIPDYQDTLFTVVCKLEGLHTLVNEEQFLLYRRVIFECLSLLGTLRRTIGCQD